MKETIKNTTPEQIKGILEMLTEQNIRIEKLEEKLLELSEKDYEKMLYIEVSKALAGGDFSINIEKTIEWANKLCNDFRKRF